MKASLVKSVRLDIPVETAVILRRVLDTAVLPAYDEQGDEVRKQLSDQLMSVLYFPGNGGL